MARGGGFSGGGRGGGFSGGGRSGGFSSGSSGRSGGFSSGSRNSSGGSFSGGNFSSFRKSSGATPPSNPTPVHTNRSSFLTGALVGSVLGSRNRGDNAYYSGGVSSNDVFPEVSGSNYKPRPEPPKGREYMHCEYCGSDYNDLNITKCQNCGAKTTRKREEVKTAGQTVMAPSSQAVTANKKKSNKIGIVIGIAIMVIVLLVAILPNVLGTNEFEPITYNWDGGNSVSYDGTAYARLEQWVYGDILKLQVVFSDVVDDLSSYGISHSRYDYCVTTVRIKNNSDYSYMFYISDLTLKSGGELYVASSLGANNARIFSERSEDGYMIIPAGEEFTVTFIFPLYSYQDLSTLSLEFREFEGDDFLGAYLIYLG